MTFFSILHPNYHSGITLENIFIAALPRGRRLFIRSIKGCSANLFTALCGVLTWQIQHIVYQSEECAAALWLLFFYMDFALISSLQGISVAFSLQNSWLNISSVRWPWVLEHMTVPWMSLICCSLWLLTTFREFIRWIKWDGEERRSEWRCYFSPAFLFLKAHCCDTLNPQTLGL